MDPTPATGGSDSRSGWQFDKKVSVQHLSTVLALVVAGLSAFNAVSKDVAVNAVRISLNETQSLVMKADIQATLNELKSEIRDLRNELKLFQLKTAKNI